MKINDIQKRQAIAKAIWEAVQGWLWLMLMFLSISVNFTHIENILAGWAGKRDWTTWGGAIIVEIISGLAFSNALANLGIMLASIGKNATKEKKRRARAYFALSSSFGLLSVTFSGWVNVLWYNGNVLAGIVTPIATVVCAIMEASRRYEIQAVQTKRAKASEEEETIPKPLSKSQKSLPTSKRREKVFALLCENLDQSPADLGKRFEVTAQTIRNDFSYLARQGKIIYKDGRVGLRPQKVIAK